MRVITIRTLRDYAKTHPGVALALEAWVQETQQSHWRSPQDIRDRYPSASFLPGNRVVFNLKGNHYRLVVSVAYQLQAVYVKFMGTHAEYDAIDAATIRIH